MYMISVWVLIRVSFLVFVAVPVLNRLSRIFKKALIPRFGLHGAMLIVNTLYYGAITLIAITILHEFGFQVHTLLGAAGVVGIAVGFAAQTSISNIISGIFLLIEQPFLVGDYIKCAGGAEGEVHEIDLLSVKIRTIHNTLIRISNSDLLKQEVTNKTYFTSRRLGLEVQIPHTYDSALLIKEIKDLIVAHPYYLSKHPIDIPIWKVVQDSHSGQLWRVFLISVWTSTQNATLYKNEIIAAIDQVYAKQGIPVLIAAID